jgi:hypothetical protein
MMFQIYYLFSQHNTYIDDIGLKPCCICLRQCSGRPEKSRESPGLPERYVGLQQSEVTVVHAFAAHEETSVYVMHVFSGAEENYGAVYFCKELNMQEKLPEVALCS